jgi:DNA modification methylase
VILPGDCLDVMATLEPESVHAIVTDPPYGLEFMGKEWDRLDGEGWRAGGGFSKPGIGQRDTPWVSFGSGDTANATCATCGGRMRGQRKCACAEPVWMVKGKALGESKADTRQAQSRKMQTWHEAWAREAFRVAKPGTHLLAFGGTRTYHRLASAIEDAGWEIRDCLVWAYASGFPKSHNLNGEWGGWGTALKPAWEPIVMARKPLRGTVAGNVLAHGTGALNIDGTRIGRVAGDRTEYGRDRNLPHANTTLALGTFAEVTPYEPDTGGRWPANVILTDPIFDGGIEGVVGGGETTPLPERPWAKPSPDDALFAGVGGAGTIHHDSGTYSRFFLVPKADRAEREPVAGTMPRATRAILGQGIGGADNLGVSRANVHPTVKPVDLMRHLVRLVTPSGGTVLDPFLGSGTTGIACEMEGFDWIGIEKEPEYVAIAEARLVGVQRGMGLSA